jgi:glycosyltransferase involved in cell wall biosynthesis
MENPLVSIALCTYNGEKYLREQIESIINQTYKNIEIIIVDDSSVDNTFEIARSYMATDARVKCFRNGDNLGFNKNFEKALRLTTGAFISISDQDDIWEPQKIEVLLNSIKESWLVFSNSVYINADGSGTQRKLLNQFSLQGRSYKALLFNNYITGHTTLFTREFLNYILPFPEVGFYDWWMGFIALYHNRLTFVDKILTKYREHPDAVTSNIKFGKGRLRNRFFEMMYNQLAAFKTYSGLKEEDSIYINKLNDAFKLKLTNYSAPLFKIVLK